MRIAPRPANVGRVGSSADGERRDEHPPHPTPPCFALCFSLFFSSICLSLFSPTLRLLLFFFLFVCLSHSLPLTVSLFFPSICLSFNPTLSLFFPHYLCFSFTPTLSQFNSNSKCFFGMIYFTICIAKPLLSIIITKTIKD